MIRKLALALLAPLLVTAACAHEADPTDIAAAGSIEAVSAVRAAPDLAADAGSGRLEMVVAVDAPEGPTEMVVTGAYDGARAAMEVDFAAMLAAAAGPIGEAVPEGFDEPVQVVVDGTATYLRAPMLKGLTGTAGWFSLPSGLGAGDSLGLTELTGHPAQLLDVLRGVVGELEDLGRAEVRGVPTTHHRGVVSVGEVVAAASPTGRGGVEPLLDELGEIGLDELPVEVWIDDEGLVRRLQLRLDEGDGPAGPPWPVTATLELFDYGEPVDIEVPAAADVTVLPGLG